MSDWNEAIRTQGELLKAAIYRLAERGECELDGGDFRFVENCIQGVLAGLEKLKRPAPLDGGWMTIESAPKDRSAILLHEDEETGIGPFIGFWSGQQWLPVGGSVTVWKMIAPTHWQPLPAAPASPEKAEGEW